MYLQHIYVLTLMFFLMACDMDVEPKESENIENKQDNHSKVELTKNIEQPKGEDKIEVANLSYPWLSEEYKLGNALVNQISLPKGYHRMNVAEGSFGQWLRFLPLATKGEKVMLHNGQQKPYQAGAFRVVNIDIGRADLQQCADAIMRLKAEYHYSRGEYSKIHFNYTSGDRVAFEDWRKGKKPIVKGNRVSFSAPTGKTDDSYSNFRKYLNNIFMYAGTASMSKEVKKQSLKELKVGDLFIQGGFPGHAVLLVDVAVHEKTGKKLFLLAQSYMPAQSIHILKNFEHQSDLSPWYPEDFGAVLHTPEWDFAASSLAKF
jgi:hypothetical protein